MRIEIVLRVGRLVRCFSPYLQDKDEGTRRAVGYTRCGRRTRCLLDPGGAGCKRRGWYEAVGGCTLDNLKSQHGRLNWICECVNSCAMIFSRTMYCCWVWIWIWFRSDILGYAFFVCWVRCLRMSFPFLKFKLFLTTTYHFNSTSGRGGNNHEWRNKSRV